MNKISIFLDGKMIQAEKPLVDSLAPGIVKGKGVFETMRVRDGVIGDLEAHLTRLRRGLKVLKIRSTYSQKQLAQYLVRTVKANYLSNARIRIAVWKEHKRNRIAIVGQLFEGYTKAKYRQGFKGIVSDVKRKKSRYAHIKSLNYACFREAFLKAKVAKYDEAILLNNQRKVVEGSRANIFFVKKGILHTPAVKEGCLNGITRRQVIQCARHNKVPCVSVSAGIRQLLQADEAFVTNSLMGIMPLISINGRPIGSGKPGPVTWKLLKLFFYPKLV